MAEEQHHQLGAWAKVNSTDSQSGAGDHQMMRPKTITALVEVAHMSQQCTALLRKAVFSYCTRNSQCKKRDSPNCRKTKPLFWRIWWNSYHQYLIPQFQGIKESG